MRGRWVWSTGLAGTAPLSYGLGFGLASFLGRLIDRHGRRAAALVTFSSLGVVYVNLGLLSDSAVAVVTLCGAWGIANHVGLNLLVGRLTALDPAQRGEILGLYSAITYLSMSAGALGYGLIFERLGFSACAYLSALCVTSALVAFGERRRTGSASSRCPPKGA